MGKHLLSARVLGGAALVAAALVAGCRPDETEIDPGDAVKLGDGALAVDPADDVVYVGRETIEDAFTFRALFRLDHSEGALSFFADLSDVDRPFLSVTDQGVLLTGGTVRHYGRSGDLLAEAKLGLSVESVSMSPSRKLALVVAPQNASLQILETASLEVHALAPRTGKLGHIQWAHARDAVLATYFEEDDPEAPSARFLGWDVEDLAASGFAVDEATGLWTGAFVDVSVPAAPTSWGEKDGLAVSAADDVAAFPARVLDEASGMRVESMVLVDVVTGSAKVFSAHHGPAGFSLDGKWLITTVPGGQQQWALELVDVLTGAFQPIGLHDDSLPYYVSHVGDDLLYSLEHEGTVHYDFTTLTASKPPGSGKGDNYLFGLTMRFPGVPFLYSIDYGIEARKSELERASFETGEQTTRDLPFKAQSAAALPKSRRIVASDKDSPLIRILDPDSGAIEAEYTVKLD